MLSTYVISLIAGPYHSWKSNEEEIPLQLFARKSLAQYVEAKEWFDITKQGLDFFEVEFGLPYPFEKYDQIIVPEFNAGAMENVGAVTFSENYVFRSPTTEDRHRRRADTILHEMSHMWFGDLVTMKWWNGLWLNESFATFMAAQAISKATHFSKGNWESFFMGLKVPAYEEDQWVTTHPIELPVNNTHQAETIFDSITYGKGASVLKQMNFYLGEENFREGIQRYFSKFAFQNTTLADFTQMQSEASEENLSHWQKSWLTTTGMNTIEAVWKCDTDSRYPKITQFELIQSAEPTASLTHKNILRKHKTQIALFRFPKKHRNSALLQLNQVIPATIINERTSVEEAIGAKCPNFVFINYADQDYSKVVLDTSSLSLISNHVSQLPDPLTRVMVWHSLWQMVVDGKIRAQDYAHYFINQKINEKNTQVLSLVLRNLVNPFLRADSIIKFLDPSIATKYIEKLEPFFKMHLLHSPPKSDLQKIWFSSYLSIASAKSSRTFLKSLLAGKRKLKGLAIDQDRRWEILEALGRMGDPDIHNLLSKELIADPTNIGEENAIAIQASLPDIDNKSIWLKHILREDSKLPLAKLRKAMSNFNILGQEEFIKKKRNFYFQTLEKLSFSASVEDQNYLQYFAKLMFPSTCDPQTQKLVEDFIKAHPHLPPVVIKNLEIGSQLEKRCIRARLKSMT